MRVSALIRSYGYGRSEIRPALEWQQFKQVVHKLPSGDSSEPVTNVAAVSPSESTRNPSARWEHYEHGADIGVRGFGTTKASAFEQAGLALTAVIADPLAVEARQRVTLACEAPDDELLFAEWLNALVYEMATRGMLFGRFRVSIDGTRLAAEAWGEPTDVLRHRPAVEVKGATYTTLRVARVEGGGWMAQTVVDV